MTVRDFEAVPDVEDASRRVDPARFLSASNKDPRDQPAGSLNAKDSRTVLSSTIEAHCRETHDMMQTRMIGRIPSQGWDRSDKLAPTLRSVIEFNPNMSTMFRVETPKFELPSAAIATLCIRHGVSELSVFGSVLRDDFRFESDVDFLIVFHDNDLGPWLARLQDFEQELSNLIGRPADVLLKSTIENCDNPIRRKQILRDARLLYAA